MEAAAAGSSWRRFGTRHELRRAAAWYGNANCDGSLDALRVIAYASEYPMRTKRVVDGLWKSNGFRGVGGGCDRRIIFDRGCECPSVLESNRVCDQGFLVTGLRWAAGGVRGFSCMQRVTIPFNCWPGAGLWEGGAHSGSGRHGPVGVAGPEVRSPRVGDHEPSHILGRHAG